MLNGVECMKELILNKEGLMLRQSSASTRELTTQAREGYSRGVPRFNRGGEIFMEGKGENSPKSVRDAAITPEAAASARRFLAANPNLLVDVKGALEEIAGGGKPPEGPPAPPVSSAGAGGADGGDQKPPTASGASSGEPDNPQERRALRVQEDQIQDPILKGYVSEVNRLIDEIKKSPLDDEKYQALYDKINALQPPDSYGAISSGDDEASQEEARIREARMDAFDKSKWILKSAMSQARRSLMPRQDSEREAISEVVRQIVDAIKIEDYAAIDKAVIDGFAPGDHRGNYSEAIAEAVELGEKMRNRDHMVEYLLEFGLERIISRADENPSDAYPQFNLYESYNIDNVIQAARKYDENSDKGSKNKRDRFGYLTNLQYKRRAMHDLFQGMKDRETYVKLVTQLLRRNGLMFVEHEIAGVADVQMMYEQVLGSKYSLKEKGWLNHQDFEEADKEVLEELEKYEGKVSESLRKEYKNADREICFRPLRDWEIRRARIVGRSLNTATERRITYGVMGELPENQDERFRSLEFEFIARTLAPLKLIPDKFFGQAMARRYFELLLEELKMKNGEKNLRKYGYVVKKDGKDVERGLYGKSQRAMAMLDTGITDLKSNSWRGRLLLLKNKDYIAVTEDGKHYTIMDYLDRVKEEIVNRHKKEIKRIKPNITELELKILTERDVAHSHKEDINDEFNRAVRDVVGRQRLALGALVQNAGFEEYKTGNMKDGKPEASNLKTIVWKNVARFLPSRIAAFLPEETLDIVKKIYKVTSRKEAEEKWNKFKLKLFKIERARVKRDAIALKTGGDGKVRELESFYEEEGILKESKEEKLIIAIQELGEKHAKDFSEIAFPFTPFLDDVPETDWNNLEDNDLDRLLINDHSEFVKGWGKIIELIANSAAKPEDIIKDFVEGFHGIATPLGNKEAQKKLEPFINAYMKMSRVNNWAKWTGTLMKWVRIPRSEAEKYNLQSQIAIFEKEQLNILSALAQHEVLNDDPTEADKNGKTQYWRVREKNNLDVLAIILAQFRIVVMLLGPVLALELFKSILPPDMARTLG